MIDNVINNLEHINIANGSPSLGQAPEFSLVCYSGRQ